MRLKLVAAVGLFVLSSSARAFAQDSPEPHPFFGVLTLGGEFGTHYAGDAKLAVFGSPLSSFALGGSASIAPVTSFAGSCAPACNTHGVLSRVRVEARLLTPYAEYKRTLGWVGVGAGLAYLADTRMTPGPTAQIALGGDLLLGGSLWFELSPSFNWSYLTGPANTLAGSYFTLGLDVGLRVDFMR